MQPLAVTHYAIANSLGRGVGAVADALLSGKSGLRSCGFETVRLDTYVGEVDGIDAVRLRPDLASFDCRNNRVAQLVLEQDGFVEAVNAARARYGPARIGVFMGTSTSGILEAELAYRRRAAGGELPPEFHYAQTHNTFSVADFVQRHLGLEGPAFVVSSACASSAKVFANAARMIAAGVCDAAVVGGVDTLCLTTLYGFNSLELLSSRPCRPYDVARNGISIGEGGGYALLEKATAGDQNGVLLLGVGESSDAYHMSTPHPEGLGAKLAMERALRDAGLAAEDIDYVNLHGTATPTNDAAEDRAVHNVFGPNVACSSTKGATGHLLGAAGITEAIITMIAITTECIPGGVNTETLDPQLKSRYVTTSTPAPVRRALTNSFGFGGSNCSLVFGRVA